ncbi:27723_t:CDS:2 [Racocetra persica]|uniref:27723_t:CDS:1 n=1 Tax=Racocetra persica TaxID=160502 RepID=A0ACA9K9F3_9GLOM|nr:27723_t:CDS:2 [Racocetra persica]
MVSRELTRSFQHAAPEVIANTFYESDPIDYNENKEIDLIIPKTYTNLNESSDELFENEIVKSIKFIPWNELNNISKLDEGYFGLVRKAYWTKTHSDVVCKELVNLEDINGGYYDAFIHELTMHTRSDLCENIVRFLGVSKDAINDQYFLIMEYANDGNLRSFLKKNNHLLNWYQRLELAHQITKGLCYLHSEEIIHRDLLLEGMTKTLPNIDPITINHEDNDNPATEQTQSTEPFYGILFKKTSNLFVNDESET